MTLAKMLSWKWMRRDMARSLRLKEMSINYERRPCMLLLNDKITPLSAELNNEQFAKEQHMLGNFNTWANNFMCSLSFILHPLPPIFLQGHSLCLTFSAELGGSQSLSAGYVVYVWYYFRSRNAMETTRDSKTHQISAPENCGASAAVDTKTVDVIHP